MKQFCMRIDLISQRRENVLFRPPTWRQRRHMKMLCQQSINRKSISNALEYFFTKNIPMDNGLVLALTGMETVDKFERNSTETTRFPNSEPRAVTEKFKALDKHIPELILR